MCEPDEASKNIDVVSWSQIATSLEPNDDIVAIGPEIFIPSETSVGGSSKAAVYVIENGLFPIRIVGDLTDLSILIEAAFPDTFVFVMNHKGNALASSQYYTPFKVEESWSSGAKIILSANMYSDVTLDSWVSLLPPLYDLPTSSTLEYSATDSQDEWRVDIVLATENIYSVVVTRRSDYASEYMFGIGVTFLIIAGLPVLLLFFYAIYRLIKKIFNISSDKESNTNI